MPGGGKHDIFYSHFAMLSTILGIGSLMAAQLIHTDSGTFIDLVDFNMIGRGTDATILVEAASVSRQHASIRRQGKDYWLTDLGSSNHTYINDFVVRSAQKLASGDRLRFGNVEFEFVSEDSDSMAGQFDTTVLQTQMLAKAEPVVRSRPVVMLVADLKAYSRLSSQLPPEGLAKLMNYWYEDCRDLLEGKEAVIDKFIGDCVFAYWHSDGPRARQFAVDAALTLAKPFARLDDKLSAMLQEHEASFDCGVGLHVGEVAIGGASKDDFTALGDAVNLAFRIESLTRNLGRDILASADFVAGWELAGAKLAACGPCEVKGFAEPVEVYAIEP
jgi:adenylate cyclase